jgi:pimeloyl-ACP methyl ester carboxylesterase
MALKTHYAPSGDVNIAYQVLGEGPRRSGRSIRLDLECRGDVGRTNACRFLNRLASCARVIVFDKRGTGLSDRVAEIPSLELRMDDVRAVMDAVGSERAVLFGSSEAARCACCSRPPIRSGVQGWLWLAPMPGNFGRMITPGA